MVFLVNVEKKDLLFAYAIFGVQYTSLTPEKHATISTLHELLISSAGRVDSLQNDSSQSLPIRTATFIAYWLHAEDYASWASSDAVTKFWASLPPDAGVWREIMTVPKSRYMFAANQEIKWGLATMLDLRPSSDKGYWGVYRHRLSDTPDVHTDPADTFTSPFVTPAKATANRDEDSKPVLAASPSITITIRHGRVRVSNPPDNLCFVREGQQQAELVGIEKEIWLEEIMPLVESWVHHLDAERDKNGVVALSTHVEDSKSCAGADVVAYFMDLAHFEKAGRSFRGHVKLREKVMSLYGPGGKLSGGKAALFVELCVLKKGDLEAEYIGCAENTGLMYLSTL